MDVNVIRWTTTEVWDNVGTGVSRSWDIYETSMAHCLGSGLFLAPGASAVMPANVL